MNQKKFIHHYGLPIELMNELFASMPLENAFGLLTKMPHGLLARNIQKMINAIKEALRNNKLNEKDCGPKLKIYDGLVLKHIGSNGYNCVRTILPIPQLNLTSNNSIITYYFEMEILNLDGTFWIGFCDQHLPLESNPLGLINNSIGIGMHKYLMLINRFKKILKNANEYFKQGDFVGIGIIRHSNEKIYIFVTCNGDLLGKAVLPLKFATLQLFPAITIFHAYVSFRMNFGKEEWKFKKFKCVFLIREF